LGLVGDDTRVWDNVKERLAKDGIELEYVKFTEYSQPNAALADGSIDLNAFQHQIFLDSYLQEHKDQELVSIGNTVNAPLGVYSKK
ncbi:MetQ/NlpA family ABC transporter substrate-binding protein, partial [Enterobacter roggenkampii]